MNGKKMPVEVTGTKGFVLVEAIEHGVRGRLTTWDEANQRIDALASFFTEEEPLPRAVFVETFESHFAVCEGRQMEKFIRANQLCGSIRGPWPNEGESVLLCLRQPHGELVSGGDPHTWVAWAEVKKKLDEKEAADA